MPFNNFFINQYLLYVTSMPTAPILVNRIFVPAGQDIQAMEKLAKVG